jgi:hypothetical protein
MRVDVAERGGTGKRGGGRCLQRGGAGGGGVSRKQRQTRQNRNKQTKTNKLIVGNAPHRRPSPDAPSSPSPSTTTPTSVRVNSPPTQPTPPHLSARPLPRSPPLSFAHAGGCIRGTKSGQGDDTARAFRSEGERSRRRVTPAVEGEEAARRNLGRPARVSKAARNPARRVRRGTARNPGGRGRVSR